MGWRRYLRRAKSDRERREEIESYIQIETDENITRGVPAEEARFAARRKFGNASQVQEEIYRMNTVALFDAFVRDLRHALRALRHNPAFTAAALLTLALGIGANTAVFSVIDSVLLRPLPYPHPEQLVALRELAPGAVGLTGADGLLLSSSMYFTYADGNRAFQSLGVFQGGRAVVTGLAEPEQVRAVFVSDGVLQTLGNQPAFGRWIGSEDQKPGAQQTVMLSYGYWQRRFGGSHSALGRSLSVDSQPHAIAGVMPPDFHVANTDFDLILPLQLDQTKRSVGLQWRGIARLRSDATIAQANADMARMLPIWQISPFRGEGPPNVVQLWRITPALRPLKDDVVRDVEPCCGR
jgi:hypothetical protein